MPIRDRSHVEIDMDMTLQSSLQEKREVDDSDDDDSLFEAAFLNTKTTTASSRAPDSTKATAEKERNGRARRITDDHQMLLQRQNNERCMSDEEEEEEDGSSDSSSYMKGLVRHARTRAWNSPSPSFHQPASPGNSLGEPKSHPQHSRATDTSRRKSSTSASADETEQRLGRNVSPISRTHVARYEIDSEYEHEMKVHPKQIHATNYVRKRPPLEESDSKDDEQIIPQKLHAQEAPVVDLCDSNDSSDGSNFAYDVEGDMQQSTHHPQQEACYEGVRREAFSPRFNQQSRELMGIRRGHRFENQAIDISHSDTDSDAIVEYSDDDDYDDAKEVAPPVETLLDEMQNSSPEYFTINNRTRVSSNNEFRYIDDKGEVQVVGQDTQIWPADQTPDNRTPAGFEGWGEADPSNQDYQFESDWTDLSSETKKRHCTEQKQTLLSGYFGHSKEKAGGEEHQ